MNSESRVTVRWSVLVGAAVALLAVGAGATYFGLRSSASPRPASDEHAAMAGTGSTPADPVAPASAPVASGALPDVVVTLSPEAVERAGITVTAVTAGTASGTLRAPGVVEPNAYKQVVVTPLVSGRVTRVAAELGQQVQRGQTIAQIFSPELAEAQTRYISARAELDAHDQELARTEKLVQIGAASRQELERVHAEHTARRADVQSVASRLQLLGLSTRTIDSLGPGKPVDATTNVAAPITGVITKRDANVGTNVDQATQLFTVVDLSTVWVVAEVYEKDFARIRVGQPATIMTSAYPELALQGRVSYIDPQVSPETRTAKVRVEVPNPRHELRLGMFAEAVLAGEAGAATPLIPRSAVQNVGDRTVAYLVDPKQPGRFIERDVRLGTPEGDRVSVLVGVTPGDIVVAEGSFYVRAERERLGLRATSGPPAGHGSMQGSMEVQQASVTVTDASFDPQRITLKSGVPARVTFTRTSDKTCATSVVFPSLNIRRDLPLNQPVAIEFTPDKSGEIAFACGMNMLRGSVVVQ
ncbi:MAG: efflux RND transporter periplasmic adaptor subunit [Acidobacteriota bacterium]|nr:efflux RND transporter periplasmic adaptor subunit [Acidobacteriota bacterium]